MQKKAVRKWKKKDGVQMEKKGVRSQGKTRIGEEECRCITLRMWGKKRKTEEKNRCRRKRSMHTHTQKKRREESRCRRKKNEDMQKNSCREVPVQK